MNTLLTLWKYVISDTTHCFCFSISHGIYTVTLCFVVASSLEDAIDLPLSFEFVSQIALVIDVSQRIYATSTKRHHAINITLVRRYALRNHSWQRYICNVVSNWLSLYPRIIPAYWVYPTNIAQIFKHRTNTGVGVNYLRYEYESHLRWFRQFLDPYSLPRH